MDRGSDVQFRPLTLANWADLETLFGPRGACGGCWCMTWRLSASAFERNKGAGNRRALRKIVASGEPTGILAYLEHEPIGWCAVAPRERYVRLAGSRVLKPVDSCPVWSVSCLYVARAHRRGGLSAMLLAAAARYVAEQGGQTLEGYPLDPKKRLPDAFAWTGLLPAFRKAGFQEVARRSPTRPIMRKDVRARP